jgi:hypothetical protein
MTDPSDPQEEKTFLLAVSEIGYTSVGHAVVQGLYTGSWEAALCGAKAFAISSWPGTSVPFVPQPASCPSCVDAYRAAVGESAQERAACCSRHIPTVCENPDDRYARPCCLNCSAYQAFSPAKGRT